MWALTRYLATSPRRCLPTAQVKGALSPPTLISGPDGDKEKTFEKALATCQEFGVIALDGDELRLVGPAAQLGIDDMDAFLDLLRTELLGRVAVEDVVNAPSQTEGKDLLRALCWFLAYESAEPSTRNTFSAGQQDSMPEHLGNPLRNGNRWDWFTYWAPALGFADAPLMNTESATALIPDCTRAVRRVTGGRWPPGTHLSAREFVNGLLDVLAVLPGGRYSTALGITGDPRAVSRPLSFALLCGAEQGWLTLSAPADAADGVQLADDGSPGRIQRVTHVDIGDPHA
jgi:hypothetical protein